MCPYCGRQAELVDGKRLYPHRKNLDERTSKAKFWLCIRCDAYVGCHRADEEHGRDGTEPLGTMANRDLRELRVRVHGFFDQTWKSGAMSRAGAYRWLAQRLGIMVDRCHVGMFDEETCRRALEVLEEGR